MRRDNSHLTHRGFTALVSVAAAAGCFGGSPDGIAPAPTARAATTSTRTSSAPPTEALGEDGEDLSRRATFAPCAEDPEVECGQLRVPLDYEHPHGPQITLATVRARATGPDRLGVLFVNFGGPGAPGVDLVILARHLFAPMRELFDIVSFDPRGTGRSHGGVCRFELPPPPSANTPEALAVFLDELGARFARACQDQVGALVTRMGTTQVARDLDVFRAALGERELNYFAFSYGSLLGATYATLFPHRVRAMVLDGNLSPATSSDYLVETTGDGAAAAELALQRIDQLCRAAAGCPLRAAGVVATYDRVFERLSRSPVFVEAGIITATTLFGFVANQLRDDTVGWPQIVRVLAQADAGDFSGLPATAPGPGGAALELPSALAVFCNDSTTRRPALDTLPTLLATQSLYPRFGGVDSALSPLCSAWPRTEVTPITNLATRHPVMLLGNDFDPGTSLAWSRAMATALGPKAALVRYQGGGHTVFAHGSACIDDAVAAYYRDPTTAPGGLACAAQPISFDAALQRTARAPTISDHLGGITPARPLLPLRR